MKSHSIIIISIIGSIILCALTFWIIGIFDEKKDAARQQYIDSLFRQSRESITFDSIRSEFEKQLNDSIEMVRKEIQTERIVRRRETLNLRRETQRLRHLLDSIGPIERPDF